MPATAGTSGYGTLLQIGDGAGPEVFTTIAEVVTISGPSLTREVIDMTNHGSPNSWREFVAGLLDGGDLTFTINYLPVNATHKKATGGLLQDLVDGTKRNFQLVFTDSGTTTWTIPAIITGFSPNAPIDDKLSADVSLKVAGEPTLV